MFSDFYLCHLLRLGHRPVHPHEHAWQFIPEPTPSKPTTRLGLLLRGFYQVFIRLSIRTVMRTNEWRQLNQELVQTNITPMTLQDLQQLYLMRSQLKQPVDELEQEDLQQYWGSNRQFLFGTVCADLHQHYTGLTIHPLVFVFCRPTGGIIGPGTRSQLAQLLGKLVAFGNFPALAMHTICHDAAGFCFTEFKIGPGYAYISPNSVLDKENPFTNQYAGINKWKEILESLAEPLPME